METQNRKDEIEIDLGGLFYAIYRKLVIIILVGVIFGGLTYGYSKYFVEPLYVSTTKVYIVNKQDPNQTTLTNSDIISASYIARDYQVLLLSEPVLEEVRDSLNLRVSIGSLSKMISVELIENTRIMTISVTTTNPRMSKAIADKVRDVANEKTKNVMGGIEAVNPVDEATLPAGPSSPNVKKNTILGFVGGTIIAIIFVVILYILDDTIKTPEDIEKRLGISVLAAIPLKENESGSKKRKKKRKKEKKKKNESENDSVQDK